MMRRDSGHDPSRPAFSPRWEGVQRSLLETPRCWVVTGAAGFVGSHLVEALLRLGQSVRGLDDLSTGSLDNLRSIEELVGSEAWSRFEFVGADVREKSACSRAIRGADFVLHQAALASVPRSIAEPDRVYSVNVVGFSNVLRAAAEADCQRVVYASSSSIYGGAGGWPQSEMARPHARSPYAATKLIGELMAATWTRGVNPPLGLRYFNLFGPRQSPNGPYAAVIPTWLAAYAAGSVVHVHGDGCQVRDFTPVSDAVQANVLAALAPPELSGVFNCGSGQTTSLLALEQHLREIWRATPGTLAGRNEANVATIPGAALRPDPAPVRHTASRAGDVRRSRADLTRVSKELGYRPAPSIGPALRRTVAAFVDGLAGNAESREIVNAVPAGTSSTRG